MKQRKDEKKIEDKKVVFRIKNQSGSRGTYTSLIFMASKRVYFDFQCSVFVTSDAGGKCGARV